jgi:hypothetical protein
MPPAASDRVLTEKQIEVVRSWIEQGAAWQTHWAFSPIKRPDLPSKNTATVRNPIDAFIQARLEREGLVPTKEADRRTLLRRLSFDLTGLPPNTDEVKAFVQDKSADAYEKQVDRLLASKHYGERMAMDWLDVARYADSHGYHIDSHRDMWPWRDWLIGAFNSNLPFDKFTVLQLAGDLLPDAGVEGKIASGFNRNHMINFEGGAIADEYLVEYVADRAETTANAWMGLTVGCARCHSHKYDPISHKEYYQFFAFFNNVDEKGLDGRTGNAKPILKLPTPDQTELEAQTQEAIKTREAALESKQLLDGMAAWRETLTGKPAMTPVQGLMAHYSFDGSLVDSSGRYQHGRTLKGDPTFSSGRVSGSASFDGQTLVTLGQTGSIESNQPFTIGFWLRYGGSKQPMPIFEKIASPETRRGWEMWFDESVLVDIQKRAAHVSIRMSSQYPASVLELRTRERVTQGEWNHIAVVSDGTGKASGLALYVNGVRAETDIIKDSLSGSIANNGELQIGVKEVDAKPFAGSLDDLRFYDRAVSAEDLNATAKDHPIQSLLSGVGGQPSKADDERIRDYYLRFVAPESTRQQYTELLDLREKLLRLDKQVLTTMVMSELEKPRETFVLARGDYRNRTDKVEPGTPAVLPPLAVEGRANRLHLAQWLVNPAHPLTARVAVNRYWQMYFGTGLVKTAENFGSQGEPPSHPELLDWLASEFIKSGWDVKAMQRLIVTSDAYRRASHVSEALLEKDPENRLLARGPRYRLPAEMIRDNALAVSGLLNENVGGKSVFPYQPAGLWEEMAFGDGFSMQTYVQSHGADLYRRSLYTFWKRTSPPAQFATFDAPDREKCTVRRTTTNTPLQALVLLNDPTYIEAARAIAEQVMQDKNAKSDKRRAARAFELVTLREATNDELRFLTGLAKQQRTYFRGQSAEAEALLKNGESAYDKTLPPAELATWTLVASTILNLDETASKE